MLQIATHVKYGLIIALIAFSWAGCNIINPVEQEPTYIHIDSFNFRENPQRNVATLSHEIPVVWAYYNNVLIGEFDLPATFPVIPDASGVNRLQLYPGIIINGLNDHIDIYPFYQPDTTFTFKSTPGKILSYEPHTSYYTAIKPYIISTFTGNYLGFGLEAGTRQLTIAPANDSFEFEGQTGIIYMNNPGVDSSVDSSKAFTIPTGNAYIEFNYKTDVPFFVGLQSNLSTYISSTPYFLGGVGPTSIWRKFYLNISQFTAEYPGTSYNFYIRTALPVGQATGTVLVDNIQLVTF